MTEPTMKCPFCGSDAFEPGFVEETGDASIGYSRWIPGELERGLFGGAKKFGKERWVIDAPRCSSCGFLAMFARHQA
jgi:hypothetical protein